MAHNWAVTLKWRNRWLLVSLYTEHHEDISKPTLCNFSWVRHALLATSHEKHLTLVDTLFFHTLLHGPKSSPRSSFTSLLYYLLIDSIPSCLCFQIIISTSRFVPLKSSSVCSILDTLPSPSLLVTFWNSTPDQTHLALHLKTSWGYICSDRKTRSPD